MHKIMSRRARLAALGGGLITAAALAVAVAGPAVADTTDTGGTAVLSVPTKVLAGLARSGVIVVPQAPATAQGQGSTVALGFTVTGGNGEVANLYGAIDLGGSLLFVDGRTGKFVTISALTISLADGVLTGKVGSKAVTVAEIGGDLSASSSSTPVPNETFSASALALTSSCAKYLNGKLKTSTFKGGTDIGALTANFDVTKS